ncbi:MAG: hypothetical protein K2X27_10165 [Candidatus Obscuribacterales bacterium]|nr:hypothetical protein [Candidatus Obscuribacterales bacterium]
MLELVEFSAVFGFMITVLAFRFVHDRQQSGLYLLKKSVPPSYWGLYEHSNLEADASNNLIPLPKPSRAIDPAYGSSRYASGCAVKSARG